MMSSQQITGKLSANLGVGPMSAEAVEAAFRYSHFHRKELMLIASKNQIDHGGGYVNNWSTAEYADYVKNMRGQYANAKVYICRDHCGPGFNGIFDLADTYDTITEDIKNGFDLIHIDLSHFKGTKDEQLAESKRAIEHCLKLAPEIMLEVGTDENVGTHYSLPNMDELAREIDFFKNFCDPEFYVVQTGSLVKEINQAGKFNAQFTAQIAKLLKERGTKLKEHNADYLPADEIALRRGVSDALNIAPQLGVIQTQLVLHKCLTHGIDFSDFIDEVYAGKKWQKWLNKNSPENKFLCVAIAGHYHFASDKYREIIKQLEGAEDIHESIINSIMDVIDHYESRL
jgi:hypothetical protein